MKLLFATFLALAGLNAHANRYQEEIDLIQKNHKRFVELADARFQQIERYRSAWNRIAYEMKQLELTVTQGPDRTGLNSSDASIQIQAISAEKVHLEQISELMSFVVPKISDEIQKSERVALELPELKAQHDRMKKTVLNVIASLGTKITSRLVQIQKAYEQYRLAQIAKEMQNTASGEQAMLEQMQVSEQIDQANIAFTYLSAKIESQINDRELSQARLTLSGMSWMRSVLPIYFTPILKNNLQKEKLDYYLEKAHKKESTLRETLLKLDQKQDDWAIHQAVRPNNQFTTEWKSFVATLDSFINFFVTSSFAQGRGKDKSPSSAGAWGTIKRAAEQMHPGTSGRTSESQVQRLSDGREVGVNFTAEIRKDVCKYNEKTKSGSARVEVNGVKTTASRDPREMVSMPSDGQIRDAIENSIRESFTRSFEVSCHCSSKGQTRSEGRSGGGGNGSSGSGETARSTPNTKPGSSHNALSQSGSTSTGPSLRDVATPERVSALINREFGKDTSSGHRRDIEELQSQVSRWQQSEAVFESLMNDTTLQIAEAHQSTERSSKVMSQVEWQDAMLESGLTRFQTAVADLTVARIAVRDFIQSDRPLISQPFEEFLVGAAARPENRNKASAAQAIQSIAELTHSGPASTRIAKKSLERVEKRLSSTEPVHASEVPQILNQLSQVAQLEKITPRELQNPSANIRDDDRREIADRVASAAIAVTRIGVGFTPLGMAIDFHDLVTGYDFFTGEELSPVERSLSAIGVVLGVGGDLRLLKGALEASIPEVKIAVQEAETFLHTSSGAWTRAKLLDRFPHLRGLTANEVAHLMRLEKSINGKAIITTIEEADVANNALKALGYTKAPYKGRTAIVTVKEKTTLYRAYHTPNYRKGGWWLSFENPKLYSKSEYRSLYSVPNENKLSEVVEVTLYPGDQVRIGESADAFNPGDGGAVQVQLLKNLPEGQYGKIVEWMENN